MAAFKSSHEHNPGIFGGDLLNSERAAYQEGHDADIPSNETALREQSAMSNGSLGKEVEPEKVDPSVRSETTSLDDQAINIAAAGGKDLEKADDITATVEEQDPHVVFWDGEDDPANPYNWSATLKWTNIFVLSLLTFLTPLASSFFAPGVPDVLAEFDSDSNLLATFVVSVYLLGFAIGPLLIAPLSELYGRVIVYNVSNLGFIAFTVGCALSPNMGALIAFRFLQGCFGVTPVTIGGGTIADMIKPEARGAAMAIWAMGPLLGPVVGPVAGGFLAQGAGWRWIFWVLAIATGVCALISLIVLRETYAPVLLQRKTKRLRKETGNLDLCSKLDNGLTPKQMFVRAIVRPTKLMFLSPICAFMSLYMAVVYGFLYLLFTTFTFVFEDQYHFSPSTVGLVYIGMGVGNFIGLALLGGSSDRIMKYLANKYSNGVVKPEYRLPMLMLAGPLLPAGLFIYGWTAQYSVQWAVPLLGTLLIGIGLIACFMCINTYLVDAYSLYAASAMAANTVLRSILGGLFPLFGLQMYDGLGLGWGNSLLAFVALALSPIPWLFYRYGERIRTNPRWQVKF